MATKRDLPAVPIPAEWLQWLSPDERLVAEMVATKVTLARSPASMAAALDESFRVEPHIELIDRHLVALHRGDIDRLLIIAPPRHGKSLLTTVWYSVWSLFKNADMKVVAAGYGDIFIREFSRQAKGLVTENTEALELALAGDQRAAGRWSIAGHKGGLVAVGMGSPLTGRGADRLVIDDPIKNWEEAQSSTVRQGHWDWYTSTARTRLQGEGAGIAVIMTLWHNDDLGSRLRDSGRYSVLHLRALAREDETLEKVTTVPKELLYRWEGDTEPTWERKAGEALWPGKFSREWMEGTRDEVGAIVFNALYQGEPAPEGGTLFHEPIPRWQRTTLHAGPRWQLDDMLVDPRQCWTFATVDLAVTTRTSSDYTVAGIFAVTPDGHLLLVDGVRARVAPEHHYTLLHPLLDRWHCKFVGVENSLHTTTLVQELARKGVPIRELRPDRDKFTRAIPASTRMANRMLWFPDDPRFDEWVRELLVFPNGAHDDTVDAIAYAAKLIPPGRRAHNPDEPQYAADDRSTDARIYRHHKEMNRRHKRAGRHPQLGTWP